MKMILALLVAVIISVNSFSQSYYFAWDGCGMATKNNYGLTYGYGSYQYRAVREGVGIGFMETVQDYNMYYNSEEGNVAGSTLRMKYNYYFLSPMVVFQLGKKGKTQCYVNCGLGDLQSGTITQHKWSRSSLSWAGDTYDSTIDQSSKLNTFAIRFGFGFVQFYHLGGNFHLFFNEDAGFICTPVMSISDPDFSQLKTNTSHLFEPGFFSLRVGIVFITHSRELVDPYRIGAYQF